MEKTLANDDIYELEPVIHVHIFKAAVLQMLKKNNIKVNGK